jgi:hypothetical protein
MIRQYRKMVLLPLLVSGGALAGCGASFAQGTKRPTVVLQVKGARSSVVQNKVATLLEQTHQVVGVDAHPELASRLDSRVISRRGMAQAAKVVDAQAVLRGYLKRPRRGKHRRTTLSLSLFDGADGYRVARFRMRVNRSGISQRQLKRLKRKLAAGMARLSRRVEDRSRRAELRAREQARRERARIAKAQREQARRERARIAKAQREQAKRERAQRAQARREQAQRERAQRAQARREQARRAKQDRRDRAPLPSRSIAQAGTPTTASSEAPRSWEEELDNKGQVIDRELPR